MKQRRTAKGLAAKGLTALGVLGMLMGALVVFAPTAGASHDGGPSPYGTYGAKGDNANLDCADLDDGTEHGEPSLDFGEQTEIPEDDTAYETRVVEGEPLHIDWTSTSPVGFVLVKQATYTAVFVVDGATSGTVYVDVNGDARASDQALSHVTFCTGEDGGGEEEPSCDDVPAPEGCEVEEPVCEDEDATFEDANENGVIDDGECVLAEVEEPVCEDEDATFEDANDNGVIDDGECVTPNEEGPAVVDNTTRIPMARALDNTVTKQPEVQNSAAVRRLPATGSGTGHLAGAGVSLLLLGVILAGGSRRSLLRQS